MCHTESDPFARCAGTVIRMTIFGLVICGFAVVPVRLVADGVDRAAIRQSLARSADFIAEKGLWWIEKKECVSCHRVGTMTWSLAALRAAGVDVDERLDEWRNWSVDASLKTNDKGKVVGLGNKEGVAQLVLTRDLFSRNGADSERDADLVALIAADQQEDGSWKPGGQLPSQKRSAEETTAVSTMWQTLALLSESSSAHLSVVEKAKNFVAKSKPGRSTEWYVVRLLLALQMDDEETAARMRQQLVEKQHGDGGWGWLVTDPSDALGTGMAVYALRQAGSSVADPVLQKAGEFLLSTQREDGSWSVHGTKDKKKGRPQETATYWGTTWAAIALAEYL